MLIGISKNVGDYQIGIATEIGKPSAAELRTKDFAAFLRKVQAELEHAIDSFIEAKGGELDEIKKHNVKLHDLFKDDDDYKQFRSIFFQAKKTIDKTVYAGDNGIVAKRLITEEIFKIKDFFAREFPHYTLKPVQLKKPRSKVNNFLLFIGVLLLPYLFAWFTLRKGHSNLSRVLAFSWMAYMFYVSAVLVDKDKESAEKMTEKPVVVEQQKQ